MLKQSNLRLMLGQTPYARNPELKTDGRSTEDARYEHLSTFPSAYSRRSGVMTSPCPSPTPRLFEWIRASEVDRRHISLRKSERPSDNDVRSQQKEGPTRICPEHLSLGLSGHDDQDRLREGQEPAQCPHDAAIDGARAATARMRVPLAQVTDSRIAHSRVVDCGRGRSLRKHVARRLRVHRRYVGDRGDPKVPPCANAEQHPARLVRVRAPGRVEQFSPGALGKQDSAHCSGRAHAPDPVEWRRADQRPVHVDDLVVHFQPTNEDIDCRLRHERSARQN